MLKDIPHIAVENIAIAIVPKENEDENGFILWDVYLLNLKADRIDNVLVASKGYGSLKGENVKTSTLRHFIGAVEGHKFTLIESIQDTVFGLNNEYWVSFYIDKEVYDKKYIFLPETIKEEFFTTIPLLNQRGVMIR